MPLDRSAEQRVPYVPPSYAAREDASCVLWGSPSEAPDHLGRLQAWVAEAAAFLSGTLRFQPIRRLHVVSFLANEEARHALSRDIPPTMALAPYAGETDCLVVVQSPGADPRNADPRRMGGILVHEMAHQFVAERTGSTKRLGDGNRFMAVSTWLNEGVAELLRYQFLQDRETIDAAVDAFERAADDLTWRDLNALLDDLDAGRRGAAFARATGAAAWLAGDAGVAALFDRLTPVNRAVFPDTECAAQALQPARRLLRA